MIWSIVIAVIVLLVFWFIRVTNSIAKKKKNAEAAFADVDVYLAQRFVAINSMVDTIKGHIKVEKHILESVINTRTKGVPATTLMKK